MIAVNTAIYSPSGGSVGIGFGIPAETVKTVVAQLKDKGYVERGWIGVKVQPVTEGIADSLGMKNAEGAIVAEAQSDAPGGQGRHPERRRDHRGQRRRRSRIPAISPRRSARCAPGASVKLNVRRKGEEKTVTVTLGKMPDRAAGQRRHRAGMTVPAATFPTSGLRSRRPRTWPAPARKGVVVTAVDPDSAAAEHGMQNGDVILDVGGKTGVERRRREEGGHRCARPGQAARC